uniref:C2H2-type domain-containing protein n=1 Tax=Sinocyclocheilus anshuiensis TaxID=1608454 RepID=A0A671LBJ7_9TELE
HNQQQPPLPLLIGDISDSGVLEELIGKIQPAREGGSDLLLPHEKERQEKSDLTQFLGMIAKVAQPQNLKKSHPDIEDEEKFLYGDEEEGNEVRKEVEEYEKIQDLLKTIGLDLGVAEISKMAARTQARLHGNTPAKTPTRRHSDRKRRSRSYSSSSSRSSSRSSSHSRSRSRRSRSGSLDHTSSRSKKKPVSPEKTSPCSHSQNKKEAQPGIAQPESSWPTTPTVGPGSQMYPSQPSLPTHPMSPYPGPPPRGVMPPDYPPRGYDPYGNYVPYMPPGWPMYPPPGMPVPPPSPMDPYSHPNIERPFLKIIKTVPNESKGDDQKGPNKILSQVMEELENLKKEKEVQHKRKENLLKDVETLRKQQGELLRKKRREKDGHKDPVLIELGQLQEDAMAQISKLRAEQRKANQKYEELVKVALILGIDYKDSKISGDHVQQPLQSKKESARSPGKSGSKTSTSYNKIKPNNIASPEKPKSPVPSNSHSLDTAADQFEYYDAGNHWCKNCNVTSGSMFDYFMHLHSKTHRKTLDPYDRPWAKSESEKKPPAGKRTSKPAKGSEFLIPVRGFFCQLCEEFFGDPICAETHVTCHSHNEKYKAKMYENPLYEQRRNLDRQAGLESQKSSEHKRKREDDEQDDMKKSKHSKGKMSSNEVETKPQYSKEKEYKNIKESENKLKDKYKKEDIDKQKYREEDDERAKIKKEEDEKKNEEATGRPGFGKFGLKKPQKTALEKEAERMAAQFLKEEEESMPSETAENKDAELDPFSKSIAAAKSIAIKLTGKALLPPAGVWLAYNENKTNPNLPPPLSPMVIRKSYTGVQNKPTPSADKSPAPVTGTQKGPTLSADLISKAFSGEEVQLKQTKDIPANPVDIFSISVPVQSPTAALKMVNSSQMKPVTPSQCVITLESDVAAPGVPEEEQKLTVILRPPPQLSSNARDLPPKTVKPKTTLAAGKAKDLFDIFYSGSAAVKTSVSGSVGDKHNSGFAPQDSGSTCRESNNKDKNVSDVCQSKEPLKYDDLKIPMREETLKNEESGVAQKEVPKNEDSDLAQIEESPKNIDSEIAQSEEPPKNEDSDLAQREESPKNIDSEIAQSEEPPKNEDSDLTPREESPKNEDSEVAQSEEYTKNEDSNLAQREESPKNEHSVVVQSKEPPKNEDSDLAQSEEPPKNEDSDLAQREESPKNIDSEIAQSEEPPKNEDSDLAQREESPKNIDSEIAQSEEPPKNEDSDLTPREESPKNEDSEVAQSEEYTKNEDSNLAQREESPKNEDSEVAQTEEPPKNEDSNIAQREESPKNEDFEVAQTEEPPKNEESNVAQREESPKNEDSEFEQAFEDAILKPDLPNEDNAKEEDFDDQQVLKSIEISVGDITVMDVDSQDTMQTNNEQENPLESEEPMSFSPLPGSFTEQLNLDTFEFNFETL